MRSNQKPLLNPIRCVGLVAALLGTILSGTILSGTVLSYASASSALPPLEDQPEEVLRTEVILEARSPRDGKPMTAAEYAELQAQQEEQARQVGTVPPQLREMIRLLRLRKALRTILPFLP